MVVLTSFTQPTDGIRHRQPNTTVYVNDNNLGKGTLYIAESRLSWIGETGNGFSIEYPHISLHAISRDLSAFPQECLFLMLDTSLEDEEHNNGEEEDGDDGMDSSKETTEMRLVPDDRGMLDAMFHAMNACQALHPDPEDSFSDEDFFEDADDEVPVEEADSQMARCCENRKQGRESTHCGQAGAPGGGHGGGGHGGGQDGGHFRTRLAGQHFGGGQGGGHLGGQGGGHLGGQGGGHLGGHGGGQGGGHLGGHGGGQSGGHFGGQGGGQHFGGGHFGGQGGGQHFGGGHFGGHFGGHGAGQGAGHFGGGRHFGRHKGKHGFRHFGGHGGGHDGSHSPG